MEVEMAKGEKQAELGSTPTRFGVGITVPVVHSHHPAVSRFAQFLGFMFILGFKMNFKVLLLIAFAIDRYSRRKDDSWPSYEVEVCFALV
jgi:hypothetical protein